MVILYINNSYTLSLCYEQSIGSCVARINRTMESIDSDSIDSVLISAYGVPQALRRAFRSIGKYVLEPITNPLRL